MLKKIASNTLAQLVAKFFGAGLTLLTTYYTIRLAGIDLYGDLTKILVLVAVGFTAIDFGLNAEVIRSSKTESAMYKNLNSVIIARLFISLLVIIILNLVIGFLPGGYSPAVKSVFWIGSLAILFQGLYTSCNSWFQYQLSYWKSTLSVVFGSLVGTVLTLYFLKNAPTLTNFVLANTLGYLVMAVISIRLLPKFENLRIYDLKLAFGLIRSSLVLGLILIASVLASKIDTVVLGIFRSSAEVGEYGFAYRIFDVILVLPVFVMNIIYPLSLREPKPSSGSSLMSKTTKVLALIAIPTAIFLYFLAPSINLVKPGLTISISVLRILAISLPLFYITAPLMWGLIAKKRDKLVLLAYIIASFFNITLNLLFIPRYGAVVAAINTGLTELFICLALLYFSHNKFENLGLVIMKLLLNTDGGSRGNPGPAAFGYVIQDITSLSAGLPASVGSSSTSGAGIILEKCGKYLGITTNNQAEYQGLLAGVKWVVDNHPDADLLIKMDSLLIVNQIKGLYKVKSPELFPIFQEVRGLLLKLPNWSIEHTYREGNTVADSLVNEALDSHTS